MLQPVGGAHQGSGPLAGLDLGGADQFDAGAHPVAAFRQAGDGVAAELDIAVIVEAERTDGRAGNLAEAFDQHRADGREGRAANGLAFQRAGIEHGLECQALEAADEVAFYGHVAIRRQVSHEGIFLPKAGQEGRRSSIHKPCGQGRV